MKEAITVVTATVNRPSLRRAVESVQKQTYKPVVHCILFQQLMRSDIIDLQKPTSVPLNIRWLPPPQPNFAQAYNLVVAMADTPLVAMLDDDCWWEPNHLETLARLMQETKADFVWSSSIIEDEDTGYIVRMRDDPLPAFEHIDTNEILFRKSCIERWGEFRIEDHRGVDGKLIERWVKKGAVYAHSSEHTIHYTERKVPEFA